MLEQADSPTDREVIYYLKWAKSEAEAIELASTGWTYAQDMVSHHNNYSVLYRSPPGWKP